MIYEKIMKQLKSFNFTDAQRKRLASIILKLDKEKQDILVSGDNIATINGQSLLNGGNISLIKTGIFTIVTELPTNDIDKDKVYLVSSTETDNENRFSEYIYTDNGWEKLGTFTAEIDLSNYVQKTDVVTDTTNGLMLASDKVKLDAFEEAEQYTKATSLPDSVISNADMSMDSNGINLKYTKDNLIDGNSSEVILQIPIAKPYVNSGILSSDYAGRIASLPYNIIHSININQRDEKYVEINWQYNTIAGSSLGYGQRISPATTSIAGVMSAADKKKLDNIIKQITLNGASTTIIDGVVDIPLATYDKSEEGQKVGGLLSNKDKSVLDDIVYIGGGIRFFRDTIYNDSSIDLVYQKANWSSNNYPVTQDLNLNINSATTSKAGVMSAADKTKLNSLINYQAGDGIDITGDTIRCTLDTSLYSIVTELPETGLPNKIYLLPSTKTEEGNIYTEYGYVDNKWEEIGKYKADVNLEPYKRALHLPSDVIKTLGVQYGANYVNVYSYKEDLDRGILSEVSEFDLPRANNVHAGIVSSEEMIKLYHIEDNAQVNKIESVSVNGTPLEVIDKGVNIPNATTEKDGMMAKADKAKLDSQPTIKSSDATGVTDNDYVVIKKSELDSILSRLSALENKA